MKQKELQTGKFSLNHGYYSYLHDSRADPRGKSGHDRTPSGLNRCIAKLTGVVIPQHDSGPRYHCRIETGYL